MTTLPRIDQVLDIKGEVCPYTFVKTKLAREMMESGQILQVIVDHRPAIDNVPRSVKGEGHEVRDISPLDSTGWAIAIRKA